MHIYVMHIYANLCILRDINVIICNNARRFVNHICKSRSINKTDDPVEV